MKCKIAASLQDGAQPIIAPRNVEYKLGVARISLMLVSYQIHPSIILHGKKKRAKYQELSGATHKHRKNFPLECFQYIHVKEESQYLNINYNNSLRKMINLFPMNSEKSKKITKLKEEFIWYESRSYWACYRHGEHKKPDCFGFKCTQQLLLDRVCNACFSTASRTRFFDTQNNEGFL